MQKWFVILLLSVFSLPLFAKGCFVLDDLHTHQHIQRGEACSERASPNSTFKIPLSLMGFDAGVLQNAHHPVWPYKPEYEALIDLWTKPHDPTSWIKESCVWYSQVLTTELGVEDFKKYVQLFDYGNQDVSGDPGANNGLTHAWLSSSLKISPLEQAQFLEKLLTEKLPVSEKAIEITRALLYVETLPNGWRLYGKTGSGFQTQADGTLNRERQIGWFVGWIQKGGGIFLQKENRIKVFAHIIYDEEKQDTCAGPRAREALKKQLKL